MKIAILCGGTGTRLWPMSRVSQPKQFQPLVGKESTFQMMVRRLRKGFPIADIFAITPREYVGLVVKQAPELPLENIIVEPETRDTLAAIGFTATVFNKRFGNETIACLWSDHTIKNEKAFIEALKLADQVAHKEKKLVEIAVRPTFPNIHLGYLQVGKMISKENGMAIFQFVKQIEKPDLPRAKKFVESWEYLWHIGYAVWETDYMLSLFKKHQPEVYSILEKIKGALGTPNQEKVIATEYLKIPKTSIDYGILEKLTEDDEVVVSADLGWNDIGAWNVLKDEIATEEGENIIQGHHVGFLNKDCLIYSSNNGKLIATIGLEGMIVVDTPDALLICPKDKSQEVKKVVEKLKEEGKKEYL